MSPDDIEAPYWAAIHNTDWAQYWRDVQARVDEEVEKYRLARLIRWS